MLLRIITALGVCIGGANLSIGQSEVVQAPYAVQGGTPSSVYHSGWGSLQADGSLQGRIVTVGNAGAVNPQAGAMVTLMRDSEILATTQADGSGGFAFQGLSAGVYEMTAESEGGFAALSFQAVRNVGVPAVMNVYASSMRKPEVESVLQTLWAPQQISVGVQNFEALIAPLMPASQSQRVALRNGTVYGQVAFSNTQNIPESHIVKVYRNGNLLATAPVDAMGRFSFAISTPGPVDILLGGSAYASLGAEIIAENQVSRSDSESPNFVAANANLQAASTLLVPAAGGANTGVGGMGPPPGFVAGLPQPLVDGGFVPGGGFGGGFGGGGFGGGFGGGSGGGGGLGGGIGGLGGLLGIAGLAVGIAALADDDEGFDGNIATPMVPQP